MTHADIEATAGRFLASVRERGDFLTGDNRVDERVAARLVGYAPGTLRNFRAAGTGPVYFHSGRITYRLLDLAAWVECRRVDPGAWDRVAHHASARDDIDEGVPR